MAEERWRRTVEEDGGGDEEDGYNYSICVSKGEIQSSFLCIFASLFPRE